MSVEKTHLVPVYQEQLLVDVSVLRPNTPLAILGSGGSARELTLLDGYSNASLLPVFLGSGMGHAIRAFLQQNDAPVAIIDKEIHLLEITNISSTLTAEQTKRVLWITTADSQQALQQLTQWQSEHGGAPLCPLAHPFYLRLDRPWYAALRQSIEASRHFDFWAKARQPRFKNEAPRILLITSQYFLMGELAQACKKANINYRLLTIPNDAIACNEFIENLLKAVLEFKPDCLLTLNHLGVDREGVLMELLEQLQLPLASWFVDNPHLIVHLYKKLISPWTTIFTWDADNIDSLKSMGFEHVFHLPLGTDPQRFHPGRTGKNQWKSPVSFVGNSMVYKVAARLKAGKFPRELLRTFKEVARNFDASEARLVPSFLKTHYPTLYKEYLRLPTDEKRLAYETGITWEATRLYRAKCVSQTLPFNPLIVGDEGWKTIFRGTNTHPQLQKELNYYEELPLFYPLSDINFNCTSKQMKGAVNQRIFDVPACGAFILTDWREQMDQLFVPEKEIAFYTEPEEVPEKISYYLHNPLERQRIATAARARVLKEHTWEHRLKTLMGHMYNVYGVE